jgi:hypothetical protein
MRQKISFLFLMAVVVTSMAASPGFAGESQSAVNARGSARPIVGESIHSDTSPALMDMDLIPPQPEAPGNPKPRKWLPNREGSSGPVGDGAVQDFFGSVEIPAPLVNFEGVNNVNGVLPPDTNGDIGPNHYVQTVNLSFAIYSRTGALLFGPANLNTLWSGFGGPCQTTNNGDPIVLYDQLADRWLISQFALPNFPSGPFYQCIAVSQTGNPLGAYHRYQFLISNTKLNDYPKFGVWPDGYYMAINQFTCTITTCNWAGQGVVAFERVDMLTGAPATMVKFDLFGVNPNLGGMLPSDLDGPVPPVGAPNLFSEVDDVNFGFPQDQLQLWEFHADFATPNNSTFTHLADLATAPFDPDMCNFSRNCIPQPGGIAVDAISDRLMYRLQYRNFGTHQTLVTNHTVDVNGANRAGVRWYELRNSGSGWTIFQQGTYTPDANHRWMGSIAMNSIGDIGLGYSVSSTSVFPSIRYTGRLDGDASGQMTQGEGTIIAGGGVQQHSTGRWGDYSMMGVDPVDDCTFWFTQEYYAVTGVAPWQTRVGSFKIRECGAVETGTLQGTVTDNSTTNPIAGALVNTSGGGSDTTDANGFYQILSIPIGTYSVTASASGYTSSTVGGVVITAGATTTRNFSLTPSGGGCTLNCLRVTAITMSLSGRGGVKAVVDVKNENGAPVSGATISVLWNLPGGGTVTQTKNTRGAGTASFSVNGGSGTYTITVTNITKTGFTFDQAGSTELSDSITKP